MGADAGRVRQVPEEGQREGPAAVRVVPAVQAELPDGLFALMKIMCIAIGCLFVFKWVSIKKNYNIMFLSLC